MNESMVTPYPLVDITTRIALVDKIRYPHGRHAQPSGKGRYLQSGYSKDHLPGHGRPKRPLLHQHHLGTDGKSLYLIELNRDQNHSELCRYDAESGKLQQVLIEERHPKYVEPQSPILFLPWDSHKFIYQSQRDGFNHLYLYNTEGELLKQLTSGPGLYKTS